MRQAVEYSLCRGGKRGTERLKDSSTAAQAVAAGPGLDEVIFIQGQGQSLCS